MVVEMMYLRENALLVLVKIGTGYIVKQSSCELGNRAALRGLMLNILISCKLHIMSLNELAPFCLIYRRDMSPG